MSNQDWTPYVLIFLGVGLVVWRLDRLGKQIEAVRDNLLLELGNAETQSEVLREREWEKKSERKRRDSFGYSGRSSAWLELFVLRQPSLIWLALRAFSCEASFPKRKTYHYPANEPIVRACLPAGDQSINRSLAFLIRVTNYPKDLPVIVRGRLGFQFRWSVFDIHLLRSPSANQLTDMTRAFLGVLSAAMPLSICWGVIGLPLVMAQKQITGPSGEVTASSFVSRVSMLICCFRAVLSG
jgi:hypothetical protein